MPRCGGSRLRWATQIHTGAALATCGSFARLALVHFIPWRCTTLCPLHWLQLNRQIVNLWLHDLLVIAIIHLDRVGMCARFKYNVFLLRQTLVHVGWQTIEVPKRRHGSYHAVREK